MEDTERGQGTQGTTDGIQTQGVELEVSLFSLPIFIHTQSHPHTSMILISAPTISETGVRFVIGGRNSG